jgi:glycosyltransferase involved in cell wall biosynthesis
MAPEPGSERPRISVIVPFHANEREIERCCAALLAQDYPQDAYEILFIDNNSPDGSPRLLPADQRIRVLRQTAPGAYAARNLGLAHATGEIIAFTDADCAVASDWLSRIAQAFVDPGTHIVVGSYRTTSARFAVRAITAYENAKNRLIFESSDEAPYYGYTNNMGVRRGVFHRLGVFPERMRGSDVILVRRQILDAGVDTVRYVEEMCVDHLEVRSARDYLRKVRIHSRSVRELRSVTPFRPLTNRERLAAFRSAARSEGYSRWEALRAFAVLVVGLASWDIGRLSPSAEPTGSPDGCDEPLHETPSPQVAGERRYG